MLVLCTGNSCRSQMAEAYLRHFGGDRVRAASAGTEPAEVVHPLALRVLREDGVECAEQRPKAYQDFLGKAAFDYLIVVCDGAARSCPAGWPGLGERLLWPFDDPAAFVGGEEEALERFRAVRDQIRKRVAAWLGELGIEPASRATSSVG